LDKEGKVGNRQEEIPDPGEKNTRGVDQKKSIQNLPYKRNPLAKKVQLPEKPFAKIKNRPSGQRERIPRKKGRKEVGRWSRQNETKNEKIPTQNPG